MSGRKIIIGDIHGCAKTFRALLDKLQLDSNDRLFLLGDYVDRGPDSKGVLDMVMQLAKTPYFGAALMGNHEALLVSDYHAETVKGWIDMGDAELLDSFGIDSLKNIPKHYIDFCNQLPLFYMDDDLILVHAGLNFEVTAPLSDAKSLLWIRNWYGNLDRAWLGKRLIVHGHTPLTKFETEAQFARLDELPVLNIDCSACFNGSQTEGLGYLCAFDYTNHELIFQKNCE